MISNLFQIIDTSRKIRYRQENGRVFFCSYSMELMEYKDIRLFTLQIVEGKVGVFPDCDVETFETTEQLYKRENEFLQQYPITEVPRKKVSVTITTANSYLKEQKLSAAKLNRWMQRTIAFTCFNIGAGVVDDIKLKFTRGEAFNTYYSEMEVIYTPTLTEILQENLPHFIDFSNPLNTIEIG